MCSGGGVYGAAQAGMLAELTEAGFRPDAVVGVSAGALNGTFMATGFGSERAEELVAIWASLGKRSVFPARGVTQLVNIVSGKEALQPDHGVRNLVERCTPVRDLGETEIPAHVGAVCVNTGEMVWWSEGDAVSRLCASAALPGVVRPVDVDGRLFFDGGVIANVPVGRAVEIGATRVLVLDASPMTRHHDKAPSTALEALLRAFGHARSALQDHQHALVPPHVEVYRISGALPAIGAADFARGAELIAAGREVTKVFFDQNPEVLEVFSRSSAGAPAGARFAGRVRDAFRRGRRMSRAGSTPRSRP